MRQRIILLLAFATILLALHVPFLRMPLHWDELGQFVPSALDLFHDGRWVTTSTQPNIHPPGLSAYLAAVWSVTGYSILATRLAMLAMAAVGLYLAFLLAIRLARGAQGVPAFAAVAFLMAAPMFYTQSMMAVLDMPAMVFTVAALLLFYDERYRACAFTCTVLVVMKETALTTPLVLGAWLWFRDGRRKDALWFALPAVALAAWLAVLWQATGSIFGNAEFAQYNVAEPLQPGHIVYAIARRAYSLFIADGHWIGALALWFGHKALRGRDWSIALWVAAAQVSVVTLFGGAVLERYLLPVLPILYTAFAVASTRYVPRLRLWSHLGLLAALLAGWFVNPPYPLPLESNLSVIDFVELQREAAQYLESNFRGRRVATVWPFAAALRDPDYGYVASRIYTAPAPAQHAADILQLNLNDDDVVVLYSIKQLPPDFVMQSETLRGFIPQRVDLAPVANSLEMNRLGYVSVARWERGAQWIQIYARPGVPGPLSR